MMKKIFSLIFLAFALFVTAKAAEGDYIIRYNPDAPVFFSERTDHNLGAGMFLVSEEKALALKEAGMLDICHADSVMSYYDVPNDTYYANQYNLQMIKATYAWSLNMFGNDVLVGVIDSGLDPNHPDIDYSRVIEGYNFGAVPEDSDYATNRLDTTDTNGHGTAVAGTIFAKRNNSLGIAGITDKVKLLPIKVENKLGSIYTSSVIAAINAGADYGCDVLNISLGQGAPDAGLEAAVNNALNKGCIVISAVGNDTTSDPGDHLRYPAGYAGVIGVGSVTSNYAHAESSVTNSSVFISAPAVSIPLLWHTGKYVFASGTSFAAPQVTAAAAIAKQIFPDITPAQFADCLAITAYDLNTDAEGKDTKFGYGLLDLEEMIEYVSALKNKRVYVSRFDRTTPSLTLYNLTGSPVSVSSIFGAYTDKKMADYDHKPITITTGDFYTHTFTSEKSYLTLRHFLWQSLKSLTPYDKDYTPRELNISVQ